MKRQQSFVASMVNKASSSAVLLDPARATGFVNAVLASMRVDQSLDNSQVLELTRRLAQLNPSQVTFRTVPVTGERSMGAIGNVVTWDGPGSSDLFTALRNDTPIPDKPSAPRVKVGPGDIRVQLLGTGDLATNATEDFDAAGYYLVGPGCGDSDGDHDRIRPRIQRVVEDAQGRPAGCANSGSSGTGVDVPRDGRRGLRRRDAGLGQRPDGTGRAPHCGQRHLRLERWGSRGLPGASQMSCGRPVPTTHPSSRSHRPSSPMARSGHGVTVTQCAPK